MTKNDKSVDDGGPTYEHAWEVKQAFPMGCRVRLSAFGCERYPLHTDREGTVIGYGKKYLGVRVRWDGRSTDEGNHYALVERARKEPRS